MQKVRARVMIAVCAVAALLLSIMPTAAYASVDGRVISDAWASNWEGKPDKTYPVESPWAGHNGQFFVGKTSHYYVRIDLSDLDPSDIEGKDISLNLRTWGDEACTYVVSETSGYLKGTQTSWSRENLTYNNRPEAVAGGIAVTADIPAGDSVKHIDVSKLVVPALQAGKSELYLHITTSDAESGGSYLSNIDSMTGETPITFTVRDVVVHRPSEPLLITRKPSDSYLDVASVAQKVVRIKTPDGSYLKVENDGSIGTVGSADNASVFGVYAYDPNLAGYTGDGEGWLRTTYAIKCLDNGKFLTTQNYVGNGKEKVDYLTEPYMNQLVQGKTTRLEVTATAAAVQWNERFEVKAFSDSKDEYEIRGHGMWSRDIREDTSKDATYPTFPVRLSDDGTMLTDEALGDQYAFAFEEVSGCDPLDVMSDIDGDTAELFWYPVDGDMSPEHYSVDGAAVSFDGTFMRATVRDLKQGDQEVSVSHGGQTVVVGLRAFRHPGVSFTQEQLLLMKEHVEKKEEPWYSDYRRMVTSVPDNMASFEYQPTAIVAVGRGDYTPAGHVMGNYEKDGEAAYFNALQWVITGDSRHADATVRILNAWASTLKTIDGRDRILGAGINSFRFLNAAEILRTYNGGYSGYSDGDFALFERMMVNVVYPVIEDLGGAMYANGNWDLGSIISIMSMGSLFENADLYQQALDAYTSPYVNGSIVNYVAPSGQTQEFYRDQAHGQLGVGYLGDICKLAENQGDDLWSIDDNKLARSYEWAARYNLTGEYDASYDPSLMPDITIGYQRYTQVDQEGSQRGELRPVYENGLAHYSKVPGVDMTWTERAAAAMRPVGFNHNDNLNFDTLTTYNGEVLAAPADPYFKLRIRQEGFYTSSVFEGDKTSYYELAEDGQLRTTATYDTGTYFQLVTLDDGGYVVRSVPTNTYLTVTDDVVGGCNVVRMTEEDAEAASKFTLVSMGANFYYLKSMDHDGRILKGVEEDGVFTLRLGPEGKGSNASADSMIDGYRSLFAVMYNTKETALPESGIEIPDTSALEKLIDQAQAISNEDGSYTAATFGALQDALAHAVDVLADAREAKADQAAVDSAAQRLKSALDGLKRVDKNPPASDDEEEKEEQTESTHKPSGDRDGKPTGTLPTTSDPNAAAMVATAALGSIGLAVLCAGAKRRTSRM